MLKDFTKEAFDIIVQAGQSNAEGCGRGPCNRPYIPDERIWFLNGDFTISVANERAFAGNLCSDFSLAFAKDYAKKLLAKDRKILIIRSAVGGTGFSDNRWNMTDDLYRRMMTMTADALSLNENNRVVAFFWHQGETDAINNMGEETYHGKLSKLFNSFRETFGAEIPIIMADFVQEWEQQNLEICKPVIGAQRRIANEISKSFFIETDGLSSNNAVLSDGDNIHFSRQAIYELGHRYFDAFNSLI